TTSIVASSPTLFLHDALPIFNIQPSEFVKILFVFYVAASLNKSREFKNVVVTTAVAAAHVLILVLSTDLGAALIFFVVYLVMLRSEEHTSELQSRFDLVCRLL